MSNPDNLGGMAAFTAMPPLLYDGGTDELHVNEFEQHSLGWHRSRLGCYTGSCIGKLMKENRQGGFSDTAMSYIYQVAATRYMNDRIVSSDKLFGEYLEAVNVETKAMRWGTEQEAHARRLYAKRTGYTVTERDTVLRLKPRRLHRGRFERRQRLRRNQVSQPRHLYALPRRGQGQRNAQESQARILLAVPKPHDVYRRKLVRLRCLLPVADAPDTRRAHTARQEGHGTYRRQD